jgi:hypothetical protein
VQVCNNKVQSEISLVDFNKHFLIEYGQARTRLLSRIDPLFISNRNNITLIYCGERTSIGVVLPIYSDLKVISHIPFTIYFLLFNVQSNDIDLSSDQLANFIRFVNVSTLAMKVYRRTR